MITVAFEGTGTGHTHGVTEVAGTGYTRGVTGTHLNRMCPTGLEVWLSDRALV